MSSETEGAGRGLSEAESLVIDILAEADIASRPGQLQRLNAVARRVEAVLAERDHWRKRAERRLATMDQLKAENDRLRAQVAAVAALADKWEQDYPSDLAACSYAADTWWRALRDALSDPAAVLAQVRAEAWDEEYVDCTCGHPNADHEGGACPFRGCGCGALDDDRGGDDGRA